MNYEFEAMREDFLSDIIEIYTYYTLNTTFTFHQKPLLKEEMIQLVKFSNPKYITYIIKDGEKICGYVILAQHKSREAYDYTGEVSIYLRDGYVGKGLGSLAVDFIENIAIERGFHVLVATICGENEKSIRLFERKGYEKCAHYKEVGKKFGKWLDVVAYQKVL